MPLDAATLAFLAEAQPPGAPLLHQVPLADLRVNVTNRASWDGPPQPVAATHAVTIPVAGGHIAARLYRPLGQSGALPVTLYFHGGGWTLCNLDTHDGICRRLCHQAGCLVLSVDYRLAPEHKFPTAVEDAYAALLWTHQQIAGWGGDPTRIAVAGDSAGANLATVCCLLARDQDGPAICFQWLIVPVTAPLADSGSYVENATGYYLTRDTMAWFFAQYLRGPSDLQDWRAFPLLAPSLAGLPPALVMTAEFDVLRDEGAAYAARLAAHGTPVTHRQFAGTIHQFCIFSERLPQGRVAMAEAATHLQRAFGLDAASAQNR